MASSPTFNRHTGGWDVGTTSIYISLDDGHGFYQKAGKYEPSRAHFYDGAYTSQQRLYILADPGNGKDVPGQRFSVTIENKSPTQWIGACVLLDGKRPSLAGYGSAQIQAGTALTLHGFYDGDRQDDVAKHFQFNLRESFADREIDDRGWRMDALQGCKIEVQLFKLYKLETPEVQTRTISNASFVAANSVLDAVPDKKASAGFAVQIDKPHAVLASRTETVTWHWKFVDLAHPDTTVAFHIRDAQIHKHSSVEMIHKGTIPNIGAFSLSAFEAQDKRRNRSGGGGESAAGAGAGAGSSSSSSSAGAYSSNSAADGATAAERAVARAAKRKSVEETAATAGAGASSSQSSSAVGGGVKAVPVGPSSSGSSFKTEGVINLDSDDDGDDGDGGGGGGKKRKV